MKKTMVTILAMTLCPFVAVCGEKAPEALEVHNYAELKAALVGTEGKIKLADDFSTEGEETAYLEISRAVVLDGNGAAIDFGFEALTGGITIKNFVIKTSEWGKAVSRNGKDDGAGKIINGDCIAIEIHNDTSDPVVVENCAIIHDVFDNNNSAIYLADGTCAEILNNTITVLNQQGNTKERGGIYVGSSTSGKISGNTIDSAKTAMPMSPVGLTANLDAMTEAVAMPTIEISGNTASSIYVTKMYTNGELFGEDGMLKEDDTDFDVRENLAAFLIALDENNSFSNKEGTLGEGENVYVVSRLDLIYSGVSPKDASVYFDVVDGRLAVGAK